jgi:hypothetical protein
MSIKIPTEIIDLPSQGKVYPEDHPLREGKVEIKYMTAVEEDILSNMSYIKEGIVLDKLMRSMIMSPKFDIKDLIVGDKNAILVACRILGFGSQYTFGEKSEQQTVDLSSLDNKPLNDDLLNIEDINRIPFTLPKTQANITFKLLTGHDQERIDKDVAGYKKLNQDPSISVTLKNMITSVEGNSDQSVINEFVDNGLLAMDARELRKYYTELMPDLDMSLGDGDGRFRSIPITTEFFWPES